MFKTLSIIFVGMLLILGGCSNKDWDAKDVPSIDGIDTGLARVYINTPGAEEIQSKENWLCGAQITIYDSNGMLNYQGICDTKGRGNMSWSFPKKSYSLKFMKKGKVLGMPAHKRWCLISNWLDRTLMRNAVAFKISSMMPSLVWTPRGQHVELFVNGTHRGNYYLCEQIRVGKDRVNVDELDVNSVLWPDISGGFVFEVDDYFDETFKLRSPRAGFPWMLKDPDEVNAASFDYVCRYVAELEDALYDESRFLRRDFARLMDLDSFVDWWLVHELTMNREPRHPKSCYMYKDKDTEEGKALLMAGPVWDFDCETFDPVVENQFTTITSLYYPRLFEDQKFRLLVQQHWQRLKENGLKEMVCAFIDDLSVRLRESDKINSRMWPVTGPTNSDYLLNFQDAVARLKSCFNKKYAWLDDAINNF